jgi:ketosteroid isomerase-like protein
MKNLLRLLCIAFFISGCTHADKYADKRQSLDKATATLRAAFARGDIPAIVAMHSKDIVKYFGGNNVITGRDGLKKQLTGMLQNSNVEFIENKVESTIFTGNTATQTSIFTIKITPKTGGKPAFAHGRSMVVYVQDGSSPSGWLSVREMAQEAPPETSN